MMVGLNYASTIWVPEGAVKFKLQMKSTPIELEFKIELFLISMVVGLISLILPGIKSVLTILSNKTLKT